MCRFEEEAYLAFAKAFFKGTVSARSVWIELVACGVETLAHGLGYLGVAVCGSRDVGHDGCVALAVEVVDAGEVAGVAYVHGVGYGLGAGAWAVDSALEIVVEDVVGIVGGYETADGEPHAFAEEGGADVAEIAAGHARHDGLAEFLELGVGIEIVEALGQEACHVD